MRTSSFLALYWVDLGKHLMRVARTSFCPDLLDLDIDLLVAANLEIETIAGLDLFDHANGRQMALVG